MNETMKFKNFHVMAIVDIPLVKELTNTEVFSRLLADTMTREINEKKEWSNVFNHVFKFRENIKIIYHCAVSGSKDTEYLQDFAREAFQRERPDIDQNAQTKFFIMSGMNKDGVHHSTMLYFLLE